MVRGWARTEAKATNQSASEALGDAGGRRPARFNTQACDAVFIRPLAIVNNHQWIVAARTFGGT